MRYTNEEALKEIIRRSGKVLKRRRERNVRILGGTSACLFTALIVAICLIPAKPSGTYSRDSVYGAFLLSPQAGGYVLVAVIAFVIGVAFTLICQRYRKKSFPGIRNMASYTKRSHLPDNALFCVAGGSMEGGTERKRTQEGTCQNCGNARYRVSVTKYTENGSREHIYYECDQCGKL